MSPQAGFTYLNIIYLNISTGFGTLKVITMFWPRVSFVAKNRLRVETAPKIFENCQIKLYHRCLLHVLQTWAILLTMRNIWRIKFLRWESSSEKTRSPCHTTQRILWARIWAEHIHVMMMMMVVMMVWMKMDLPCSFWVKLWICRVTSPYTLKINTRRSLYNNYLI